MPEGFSVGSLLIPTRPLALILSFLLAIWVSKRVAGRMEAQIKFGARGGSGNMPGFAQGLSDQDVKDVIAWFQDKWSDEIYASWLERER